MKKAAASSKTIDVTIPLSAGEHRIGVTFLATNFAPGLDMNHAFERSTIETGGLPGFTFYPHIGSVRIDGPSEGKEATDSPSRKRIFTCHPGQAQRRRALCARHHDEARASRVPRHSHSQSVDALMGFYSIGRSNNGSFDDGVAAVVQRVLVDPKFLYRVESTPNGVAPGAAYRVNDLDLASRLSRSSSGAAFRTTAAAARRVEAAVQAGRVQEAVRRMLGDPRASALTRNFAAQWLRPARASSGHAGRRSPRTSMTTSVRPSVKKPSCSSPACWKKTAASLDLLDRRLHVRERAAGASLRHSGARGRSSAAKLDGDLASRQGLLGKGRHSHGSPHSRGAHRR